MSWAYKTKQFDERIHHGFFFFVLGGVPNSNLSHWSENRNDGTLFIDYYVPLKFIIDSVIPEEGNFNSFAN